MRFQWQNFKGWQLTDFYWVRFYVSMTQEKQSEKQGKFLVRYWIASQSRYKAFSDIAAKKQSYHCAPHWQAYIHIATEEPLSDISSINSLAKFSSEASLQLAKHKTHKNK